MIKLFLVQYYVGLVQVTTAAVSHGCDAHVMSGRCYFVVAPAPDSYILCLPLLWHPQGFGEDDAANTFRAQYTTIIYSSYID